MIISKLNNSTAQTINKQRAFTAVDSVLKTLERVKAQQEQWRLQCSSSWLNSEGFVFTNKLGKH